MNSQNNKKMLLMISAALCSIQLFVFAPVSLYFTNLDEMNIALISMLKLLLIPALLLFLVLVLAGSLFPKVIHKRFIGLLAIFSSLVWLQSNVMLWDYGLLDGRLIDWSKYQWQGWVDISLWLIAIVVAWRLSVHNKLNIVMNVAICLFVLQLITTVFLLVQNREKIRFDVSDSDKALESIYGFSAANNIVHLMVDGFQSDVFNDLINFPKLGEIYRKSFSGFIYYPETLGVFPYTRFSVPAFLGGQLYGNNMPQDDFVDKVLSGNNIINLAYDNGYEVDIGAGDPYLEKRYAHLKHNNLYNPDNVSSPMEETAKIIDLALFRAVPHFFKSAIYNEQKWRVAPIFAGDAGMQFKYFKHTYFLNNWIVRMVVGREKPVYKYIHVMNTHNPMVVNASCNYDGKVSSMTRQALTIQTKCTLDTLVALFDKMKALGIYDNALIIVQGDHGGWTGNHRSGPPIVFYNGIVAPDWVASLASPMLAIKQPHKTGDIVISKKLVSIADLPDSISDIMGWDGRFGHQSIMKLDDSNKRERIFRFYGWRENEWSEKYAAPIQEFVVKGSHYEVEWQAGKVYLPPKD